MLSRGSIARGEWGREPWDVAEGSDREREPEIAAEDHPGSFAGADGDAELDGATAVALLADQFGEQGQGGGVIDFEIEQQPRRACDRLERLDAADRDAGRILARALVHLDRQDRAGSLETGQPFDAVLVDGPAINLLRANVSCIRAVFKAGRMVHGDPDSRV